MHEQYIFLRRDLEVLKRRLGRYQKEWRDALSGIHDSTTQSSETWHDNPLFDDVQQRAKMLGHRAQQASKVLSYSTLVEPSAPDGRVDVGSIVRLRYTGTGKEEQFVIGSYMVLDGDEDRISYAAPFARLMLGHTKGERVSGQINLASI